MNIIDELEWRDAINQQTDAEGLRKLTEQKAVSLYCGVDPTGDSMHIGHLIPFMVLKRFQLAGHRPVILIGVQPVRSVIQVDVNQNARCKPWNKSKPMLMHLPHK